MHVEAFLSMYHSSRSEACQSMCFFPEFCVCLEDTEHEEVFVPRPFPAAEVFGLSIDSIDVRQQKGLLRRSSGCFCAVRSPVDTALPYSCPS